MLHSSWDMETYARTHQEDRLREAAKARQLHLAGLGWGSWISELGHRVRGAVASIQVRLAGEQPVPVPPPAGVLQGPGPVSVVPVAPLHARPERMKPIRAAEPYAAMVVVARPAAMPVAERS